MTKQSGIACLKVPVARWLECAGLDHGNKANTTIK